jgi:hypothetical protein
MERGRGTVGAEETERDAEIRCKREGRNRENERRGGERGRMQNRNAQRIADRVAKRNTNRRDIERIERDTGGGRRDDTERGRRITIQCSVCR